MDRDGLEDRVSRSMFSLPFSHPHPNPHSHSHPHPDDAPALSWSSHDSIGTSAKSLSRLSPRPLSSTPSSGLSSSNPSTSRDRFDSLPANPLHPDGLPLPLLDHSDRPFPDSADSFFHDPDNNHLHSTQVGNANPNPVSPYAVPTMDRSEEYLMRSIPQGHLPMPTPQHRNAPHNVSPLSPELDHPNGSQFQDLLLDFDNWLRQSTVVQSLLDRLRQCESSTKAIQGELATLHQKVNLLLDRTASIARDQVPEFRDPFAVAPIINQQKNAMAIGPRALPPHVRENSIRPSDELAQVMSRMNALSTSVGHLLALQSQQQLQPTATAPSQSLNSALDAGTKSHIPSNLPPANIIGLGAPPRPEFRGPLRAPNNMPSRTWSTGNLEVTINNGVPTLRHDPIFKAAKRGSMAIHPRKDSPVLLDIQVDNWSGNLGQATPTREQASSLKWDNLPILPDLMRSITKFGLSPPNKVQQRALPFLLKGADVIAQAPPTQERIAAYAIPAINMALGLLNERPHRGPLAILISTTVDQATQAQRMIRDLGSPLGVRSSLAVGSNSGNGSILQELRQLHHTAPHVLCGTPQKLHALFLAPGGVNGSDVRFLVLDEVDQLIARNLQEFVYDIVKLLPTPRNRLKNSSTNNVTPPLVASPQENSPETLNGFQHLSFRARGAPMTPENSELLDSHDSSSDLAMVRQTALFSNTVPQDVLNLANAIDLREPVRVLVRRDGSGNTEGGHGTRGLRQFYLYLAFTSGARKEIATPVEGGLGIIGSGRGIANNAETVQAREWKLDALVDLFDDVEIPQVIVHVGGLTALDNVVYKLVNRGFDAIPLHGEMNAGAKLTALNKFRAAPMPMSRTPTRILVVNDVQLKAPDVCQIPLIINYDLPKAVEEYAQRVAPAVSSTYSKAGVVVNFVTATGGDVEMLRSIECFYKIKCPEVPTSLRDLL